ncbi:MAG: glycosyltransferase family 2 protein [Bacteroidetes bacterium]|nr:MAG: glycosyltransferase family 2 protein [Bacteroidota bacterium]
MQQPLVSIIMAAFNSSEFISDAIVSVMNQSYINWELIIVNDGSTDNTFETASSFKDKRIKVISQENRGVSAARNSGLAKMNGEYFCFLDADDILPCYSLDARVKLFLEKPEVSFVDGRVEVRDLNQKNILRVFQPSFQGNPFDKLISLSGDCYLGLTWMIRRAQNKTYRFKEGMTHCEDLLFYVEISQNGIYNYVEQTVLIYRINPESAMSNLKGLESGYNKLIHELKQQSLIDRKQEKMLSKKTNLIMLKSYMKKGMILNVARLTSRYIKLRLQ